MTLDQAILVIDTLAAPYPWWTLDDQAIDAWSDAITASGADSEHASTVARHWGTRNDRPPSLAQFLALVRPAPQPPVHDADEAPAMHPTVTRKVRAAYAEACRAIDARAAAHREKRGIGGHWHGGGWAGCPICSHRPPRAHR